MPGPEGLRGPRTSQSETQDPDAWCRRRFRTERAQRRDGRGRQGWQRDWQRWDLRQSRDGNRWQTRPAQVLLQSVQVEIRGGKEVGVVATDGVGRLVRERIGEQQLKGLGEAVTGAG